MEFFRKPEPLRLSEWAAENFYLSAESSYVQGKWEAYPYQIAIMDAISNDDIKEITLMKSARVGYTKIILASMAYFAEHKRRNQGVWQPVDDDADEFVKTEIDTMVRDVPAIRKIFPWYETKSKHNTLRQKTFLGSILHIRGGKSAKNYRRLSLDVAYLDELDGFDSDVEGEGTPDGLSKKRLEGATFPKLVCGSTPKIAETSLVFSRFNTADARYYFTVPCPHCGAYQSLKWGGKHEAHGMKWSDNGAYYMCEHCAATFDQQQYLKVWDSGIWRDDDGNYIGDGSIFYDKNGKRIDPPEHIAFHVWTAYSPQATWTQLVKDWRKTKANPLLIKTFVNTTLGEPWQDASEKSDPESLYSRRENYTADLLPDKILYLTAGVDVQDDRLEMEIVGWRQSARDEPPESWGVEYKIFRGDPAKTGVWDSLDSALQARYHAESGRPLRIQACCVDSGGHHTAQVYAFCNERMGRHIYATKGMQGAKPIWTPKARKSRKYSAQYWPIGSDSGKDAWYSRLRIAEPGPGYCHFPIDYDMVFFNGLTAEQVRTKYVKGKPVREWFLPSGRRNEPLDIRTLALAALLSRPIDWLSLATARPIREPYIAPKSKPRNTVGGGFIGRTTGQSWLR